MKKVSKLLLLGVLMAAYSSLNAQKIAHIHLDSLIAMMPEAIEAKKASDEHLKMLQNQIVGMEQELQQKYDDYQANSAKLSDLLKKTKEQEITDLNKRVQDFQMQAQQELQTKNSELAQPIYEKAKKVIKEVAAEKGYKYVLDSTQGMLLYSDPADDIFNDVKKKLGLTGTPAGATAPKGK